MLENKRIAVEKHRYIGKYEVMDCIGHSFSSLIYQVMDTENQEKKILKEYYPYILAMQRTILCNALTDIIESCNNKPYYFDEYKTELELHKLIYPYDHPSLFHCENKEYLLWEHSNGCSLRFGSKYKKDRIKTVDKIIELYMQLLESIKCIHDQGYIHGNILPDNLYLLSDTSANKTENIQRVINLDLVGIWEKQRQKEKQNRKSHLPKYAPIELRANNCQNRISFGSDIYSISSILFELLYDECFSVLRHTKVRKRVLYFNPNLNTKCSIDDSSEGMIELKEILLKALTIRYENCETILQELKELQKSCRK